MVATFYLYSYVIPLREKHMNLAGSHLSVFVIGQLCVPHISLGGGVQNQQLNPGSYPAFGLLYDISNERVIKARFDF